jgi:hypothetical protein
MVVRRPAAAKSVRTAPPRGGLPVAAGPRRSGLCVAVAFVAVLGLLGGGSCSDGTYPTYFEQTFPILVDSLAAPAAAAAGDTVTLRFWGYVGPNDCHAFGGVTADWTEHAVVLTLWYHYYRRAGADCLPEAVYLEGEPYRLGPLPPGPFTITVAQPDGSAITDTLHVASG